MIPKIIWQTHEWDYQDLPNNFKRAAMTWQNLNPDWEYRYANAAERAKQVESFSPELYLFYPFMDKPTQADIWRYIVVYENGGAYADMDSICVTPLDFVVDQMPKNLEIAGPEANEDNLFYNANFFAIKNSNLLEKMIEGVLIENHQLSLYSIINASKSNGGMSIPEAVSFQLRNGLYWYSSTLHLNIDRVWANYNGFIHMSSINESSWQPDYEVDYYGEPKKYLDLVKENNWSLI
jgi:hypothetical protein